MKNPISFNIPIPVGNKLLSEKTKTSLLNRTVLFCVFLLSGLTALAQRPIANFTSNITQGCASLTVRFTDQSTNNPTSWAWQFGDEMISEEKNPVVVFTTPGIYTVRLTVRNASGVDGIVKTDYITVFPSARIDFTPSTTVSCLPAEIKFNNGVSIDPPGNITSYLWDFGDGTTSTEKDPVKIYNTIGFFDVRLTVTTDAGCTVTRLQQRLIRTIGGITPNFDFTRLDACVTPISVNFINQTTGPGTLDYRWTFGNSSTSTDKNPSTSYNSTGNYTVKLVAKSSYGCSDSITRSISITGNQTRFNAPASSCPGKPIQFENISDPIPDNVEWDFGDGTMSFELNPLKVYTTPGTYTVKLTTHYADCEGTATKTITITNPPTIDFTSNNRISCVAPHTVQFQAQAPGATSWVWDFGDGTTSTEQNPSHTYTEFGTYDVRLTTVGADSCQGTVFKAGFVVVEPSVPPRIINSVDGGCVPYTYTPQLDPASVADVASYEWDFGNGVTSTSPNPSVVYTSVGKYTVRLRVTTNSGCVEEIVLTDGVKVGTPPTVDFTVNKNSSCAGEAFNFTSLSSPADEWRWNFGDGGSSSAESPAYLYQDTGYFDVKLIAINNGCRDSITKSALVYVMAPVARFTPKYSCVNRLQVEFEDNSIVDPSHGPATYFWDFGNGQTSNQITPTVIYPSYGTYTVTLTITDPVCSYTKVQTINLFPLEIDFTVSKPSVCRNELFTLTATGTDAANISSYTWQIEGLAPVNGDRTYRTRIGANGTYDVTLTVTDIWGCTITHTIPDMITVVGAAADFSVVNNGGCVNSEISITDQSTPAGSITNWTFDFGDGESGSYTSTPITHVYRNPGNYSIKLTTTDNIGCVDTITKPAAARITKPVARFAAPKTRYCPDMELAFRDSSIGTNLTYLWDFGDGNTSTARHPMHAYTGPDSVYTVKLYVRDGAGCEDSLVREEYIHIISPKAAFTMIDTAAICPPLETKFTSLASDYDSLYWDFGDGNTSTLPNTNNFFNTYGKYTVTLNAIGPGGCLVTATGEVNIYNPFTDLVYNYSPTEDCNEITVNFNVVPPPNTKYYLVFNDNTIDSSQQHNVTHTYRVPNTYRPFVRLVDSLNCEVPVGKSQPIMVKGVIPAFNTDQREFCDNGTVKLTDFSIGNDAVILRRWDFGDGSAPVLNQLNPSHSYAEPGRYVVTQYVATETGCENSFTDTVRVYRTPEPVITGPDEICLFEILSQTGSTVVPDSATLWTWNLGNGQSANTNAITTRYTNSGQATITLKASVAFGCNGTVSKNITVWPLPVIENIPQVTVPLGFDVTLPVTYSDNVTQWTWSPGTDLSCTDCPTPVAAPKFTTNYKVNVVDENGCRATSNIVVKVICENKNYFLPNTFSPNNDGQNDVFYPRGRSLDRIQSMRIFNRWGELVFERKNFPPNSQADGWNGLIAGKPAASDAYVYIIEVVCENGQVIPIKGNVTLIR